MLLLLLLLLFKLFIITIFMLELRFGCILSLL